MLYSLGVGIGGGHIMDGGHNEWIIAVVLNVYQSAEATVVFQSNNLHINFWGSNYDITSLEVYIITVELKIKYVLKFPRYLGTNTRIMFHILGVIVVKASRHIWQTITYIHCHGLEPSIKEKQVDRVHFYYTQRNCHTMYIFLFILKLQNLNTKQPNTCKWREKNKLNLLVIKYK